MSLARKSNCRPSDDDLRALLTHLRRFIQDTNDTYINYVYNICFQFLDSEKVKRCLAEAKGVWKEKLENLGIRLKTGTEEISPTDAFGLWVNAWYLHADVEARKRLRSLHDPTVFLTHQMFLMLLSEALRQVYYLRHIITIALRDGLFGRGIDSEARLPGRSR